jgi:hypothetical protein
VIFTFSTSAMSVESDIMVNDVAPVSQVSGRLEKQQEAQQGGKFSK